MVSLCGSEWEPSTQRSQQWSPGWLTAALLTSEALPGQNFALCGQTTGSWKCVLGAVLCRWAGEALAPFLQKSEGDEGLRQRHWVSGWVGVFLFSNKSTQNNQRFPVTTVPASLALLSKMYFSSHLHTYPSLYLNYQHLNFCGWLQPEFGSFRWE